MAEAGVEVLDRDVGRTLAAIRLTVPPMSTT